MTPLTPKTFQQKSISEQVNQDLGKHIWDFLGLFEKLNVPVSKSKGRRGQSSSEQTSEELLEKLEKKQDDLITEELSERAMHELSFASMTDFELLKHQKKGLIWILERENFYENNGANLKSNMSGFVKRNFDKFLNPLWTEYILKKDIRTSAKNKAKIERNIVRCNPENQSMADKFYFYFHKMTGQMVLEFPDIGCHIDFQGGLIADEMGLGKTILILSLIGISKIFNSSHQLALLKKYKIDLENENSKIIQGFSKKEFREIEKRHQAFKLRSKSKGKLAPTGLKRRKNDKSRSKSKSRKKKYLGRNESRLGGNLIVVPTILMAQWEEEIRSFFKKVGSRGN